MLSAERIKHIRIHLDLTQTEVAKQYIKDNGKKGCSSQFVNMLEGEKEFMTDDVYRRLMDAIYKASAKKCGD